MKKIFKRLIAYIIDIFLITALSSAIMQLPLFNNDLANYNKYYKQTTKIQENYIKFNNDLKKYYKDKKLTKEEYDKLLKYKDYNDVLEKYYKDDKLSKKDYSKLEQDSSKLMEKEYKTYYYKLNKSYKINNIIYIALILLYFVGVNLLTNGQTLGKKVMKLKIVNNSDEYTKVSAFNYFLRALVLYNPLYYLMILLGVELMSGNSFYNWMIVWSNIQNYLQIVIMVMILARVDNRGLHELLSKTKVIEIDDNYVESIKSEDKSNDEDIVILKNKSRTQNKSKKRHKPKKIVVEEDK